MGGKTPLKITSQIYQQKLVINKVIKYFTPMNDNSKKKKLTISLPLQIPNRFQEFVKWLLDNSLHADTTPLAATPTYIYK